MVQIDVYSEQKVSNRLSHLVSVTKDGTTVKVDVGSKVFMLSDGEVATEYHSTSAPL